MLRLESLPGQENMIILLIKFTVSALATFTFMHVADAFIFIQAIHIQAIHFFVSTCVPWESNPQPLRCSNH